MRIASLLLMAALGLSACAETDIAQNIINLKETEGKVMRLRGEISIRGNSRMSHLSIMDSRSGITYKINNSTKFELQNMQNQTIVIKAKFIQKARGPGFPAEVEVLELLRD